MSHRRSKQSLGSDGAAVNRSVIIPVEFIEHTVDLDMCNKVEVEVGRRLRCIRLPTRSNIRVYRTHLLLEGLATLGSTFSIVRVPEALEEAAALAYAVEVVHHGMHDRHCTTRVPHHLLHVPHVCDRLATLHAKCPFACLHLAKEAQPRLNAEAVGWWEAAQAAHTDLQA